MSSQPVVSKRNYNALPDDPEWCGHPFVSLRTWMCGNEDCERPVTPEARRRLESAPTQAPPGSVWALERGEQDHLDGDGEPCTYLEGLYSDRALIPRLLIRNWICGAGDIRDVLRRTHWFQGAINEMLFEGWAETPNDGGKREMYRLSICRIDAP